MRSCLMDEWIIKYYVNEVNTIRKALLFYRRPVLSVQGNSQNLQKHFHPSYFMKPKPPLEIQHENNHISENENYDL